jgi:hypothetical protein
MKYNYTCGHGRVIHILGIPWQICSVSLKVIQNAAAIMSPEKHPRVTLTAQ